MNGKYYCTYFAVQSAPRKQRWSVQKRTIKKGKLHAKAVVMGRTETKTESELQRNKNLGKE